MHQHFARAPFLGWRRCVLSLIASALCFALTVPRASSAAELANLWPNDDGLQWTYSGQWSDPDGSSNFLGALLFDGTQMLGGREVQNLRELDVSGAMRHTPVAGSGALVELLWRMRTDLRPALEARYARAGRIFTIWPFLFLGPAEGNVGFLETADHVGVWRDELSDWSWWYLSSDLFVGATFQIQLIPDLASDVFLDGTVSAVDVPANAGGRSFDACTVVDYVVDTGVQEYTTDLGIVLGTARIEITGSTTFASGIGPIATSQTATVVELDCPLCPFGLGDVLEDGQLELLEATVGVESATWGEIKSRW